jgi:hypothetical protein
MTLITQDERCGDPRQYPPPHAGAVIVNLPNRLTISGRLALIDSGLIWLVAQPDMRSLASSLVTIEPGRVRLRQ